MVNITIDNSHHITFFTRTAIGQDRRMDVVFSTRDPVWCRPHAPDAAHTAAPGGEGGEDNSIQHTHSTHPH